jgi:hypothetical protein
MNLDEMKNGGIFGMIQSGKTTLAGKISRYFNAAHARPSIVLDPVSKLDWGKHSTVFSMSEESAFWETAWRVTGCLVIVDESSTTIARDKDLIPVFTRLHHNNHKILVICHNKADLLPTMRQQFTNIFLFRQPEESAKIWASEFTQPEIRNAEKLAQYQFMACGRYAAPETFQLTP